MSASARLFAAISLLLALCLPGSGAGAVPGGSAGDALSPEAEAALAGTGPTDTLTVIVNLQGNPHLGSITAADPDARDRRVVEKLKAELDSAARHVEPFLDSRGVERVRRLWISGSLAVTATPDTIRALATRPGVTSIAANETVQEPEAPVASAASPEANLDAIGAPELWARGITGRDVVVATMDTGVDAGHPDLAGRWRGGLNSWFDASGEHPEAPTDRSGHGTQVMGVIVGRDAGGTAIGVAPDAVWISARIFNDRGLATTVGIHRSFQWLLDPDGDPATPDAPDVVNASWAMPNPGCDPAFRPDLQALRASNVLPVFAAGNYGPNPSTSTSPANYPEALAVGATDNAGNIYPYSSRGPSACEEPEGTYPEVVAPGVGVRTADLFGTYTAATGTSVSAPHAAGVLALLLGESPGLTADQQREALVRSAVDLGATGPDNEYGHGMISAPAALAQQASVSADKLTTGEERGRRGRFVPTARFKAGDRVTIRAHVVDREGQDLEGATVELAIIPPEDLPRRDLSALSGADGIAELSYGTRRGSPRGTYTAEIQTVRKPGYAYTPTVTSARFSLR